MIGIKIITVSRADPLYTPLTKAHKENQVLTLVLPNGEKLVAVPQYHSRLQTCVQEEKR